MNLLTIKDAAEELQMSEGWIKKAIREKKLKCARFGRAVRIRPEDLAEYVAGKIEGDTSSQDGLLTIRASFNPPVNSTGYRP